MIDFKSPLHKTTGAEKMGPNGDLLATQVLYSSHNKQITWGQSTENLPKASEKR